MVRDCWVCGLSEQNGALCGLEFFGFGRFVAIMELCTRPATMFHIPHLPSIWEKVEETEGEFWYWRDFSDLFFQEVKLFSLLLLLTTDCYYY